MSISHWASKHKTKENRCKCIKSPNRWLETLKIPEEKQKKKKKEWMKETWISSASQIPFLEITLGPGEKLWLVLCGLAKLPMGQLLQQSSDSKFWKIKVRKWSHYNSIVRESTCLQFGHWSKWKRLDANIHAQVPVTLLLSLHDTFDLFPLQEYITMLLIRG